MSLIFNTKTYANEQGSSGVDAARYYGPLQDLATRDHLDLRRTWPKPTETYGGNAKTQAKFTRTFTDGTSAAGNGFCNIQMSLPAVSAEAEVDAFVADFAAFVGSAAFLALVKDLKISHV